MVYTPTVPQATQTIAFTQPLIQDNFGFIQTDAQVEHSFNGNVFGQAEGTHLKVSMPDRALSPAVPAGCTGVWFNAASAPFFFDTNSGLNWQLNSWERVLGGTFTSGASFSNISAIPANKVGVIYFSGAGFAQSGVFYTDSGNCYGYSTLLKQQGTGSRYFVELNNNNGALFLQGQTGQQGAATYNYIIQYRNR